MEQGEGVGRESRDPRPEQQESTDQEDFMTLDAAVDHNASEGGVDPRRLPEGVAADLPLDGVVSNLGDNDDDDDDDEDHDGIGVSYDDDDTDNWSRLVETDEVHPASVPGDGLGHQHSSGNLSSHNIIGHAVGEEDEEDGQSPVAILRPSPRELTMKEKLVLRERERRIESKRARLKRQFALSNNNNNNNNNNNGAEGESHDSEIIGEEEGGESDDVDGATESVRTLGEESTMVHLDEEEAESAQQSSRLPVTMERFLRNSDSFNPQLEPTDEEQHNNNNHHANNNSNEMNNSSNYNMDTSAVAAGGTSGVLMERFLNDQVAGSADAVNPTTPGLSNSALGGSSSVGGQSANFDEHHHHQRNFDEHQRTVSFDVDLAAAQQNSNSAARHAQSSIGVSSTTGGGGGGDFSIDANTSIQAQVDDETSVAELFDDGVASSDDTPLALHGMGTSSAVSDEPRVLSLTEADMREMVATEVESIANYPPSERDNLSEVGELADFPAAHAGLPRGDISQDTPTTVMDSASLISGGHGSEKVPSAVSSDRHSVDDGAGSVNDTIAAQPPSERDVLSPTMDLPMSSEGQEQQQRRRVEVTEEMKQPPLTARGAGEPLLAEEGSKRLHELRQPIGDVENESQPDQTEIVNRRIRPGMVGLVSGARKATQAPTGASESVLPAIAVVDAEGVEVDDFDYDKHDHNNKLPGFLDNDSFRDLPDDPHGLYSPDMQVSPLALSKKILVGTNSRGGISLEYGAVEEGKRIPKTYRGSRSEASNHEAAPLLGDVPPEIITRRQKRDEVRNSSLVSLGQSLRSRVNSVFSDVRSEEEEEKEEIHNESRAYLKSSTFSRAVPERIFALTVTLALEMPVLLMISGGADALCDLLGRRRYQLLLSFIPLTSAISGNVGLQASTLTTRAISHSHVTEDDFWTWFLMEIGAATYLGLGMGTLLGLIAFIASEMDFAFSLTIVIAQCLSIVTAGCTGTVAPLLFTFIFKRDAGKWGGPLETAVQDIVGSFVMVVLSYHLLSWFGAGPIDPSDTCG